MAMVRDLPLEDRPRERLISHGSEHLSNAELLAILIRSGSKDKSAIQLAEEVLGIYKESGIHNMSQVTVAELTKLKGIGEAKAAEIIAWNIWQMDGTRFTIPDTDNLCTIMEWHGTEPIKGKQIIFKQLIKK